MWGGVTCISDAGDHHVTTGMSLNTCWADALSEELFRMHCSKEDQCMAVSAVGRLVASDVQQEAQA